MIQRKQTLFLLQLVFLGIALLFVPLGTVSTTALSEHILLSAFRHAEFQSTWAHTTAILLNFINLLLAFTTIFLYKKRETQIKLIYLQLLFWIVLAALMALFPFAEQTELVQVSKNYFGVIICLVALLAGYFAIRNVKKDIELLKSADRIR